MLIRGRAGRLRAAIGTLALTLVLVATAAQPASAVQQCPGSPGHPNISAWQQIDSRGGVTVCKAHGRSGIGDWEAVVHIVDRLQGAKLRLMSEYYPGQSGRTSPWAWRFTKRTAQGWFDWIRANNGIPSGRQLVSATNASFFTVSSNDPASALSLPEKQNNSIRTWGLAYNNRRDDAWPARKRALTIGHAAVLPQHVGVTSFPQDWTPADIASYLGPGVDGTVGFEPTYLVPDSEPVARRTILGNRGDTTYLLHTVEGYTLEDAQRIFQHFAGGLGTSLQLDGGGSSQVYSIYPALRFGSSVPVLGRKVPDAIAIYMHP
jgi:hypothetical protein